MKLLSILLLFIVYNAEANTKDHLFYEGHALADGDDQFSSDYTYQCRIIGTKVHKKHFSENNGPNRRFRKTQVSESIISISKERSDEIKELISLVKKNNPEKLHIKNKKRENVTEFWAISFSETYERDAYKHYLRKEGMKSFYLKSEASNKLVEVLNNLCH